MKDSEKHLTMEQYMHQYQYSREKALLSFSESCNNVRNTDINDLEKRIRKECVEFQVSFVLNLAVRVRACLSLFHSPL